MNISSNSHRYAANQPFPLFTMSAHQQVHCKDIQKANAIRVFHSVIAAKAWFQSKKLENEHFTQIYELVNYLDTPPPVPY